MRRPRPRYDHVCNLVVIPAVCACVYAGMAWLWGRSLRWEDGIVSLPGGILWAYYIDWYRATHRRSTP